MTAHAKLSASGSARWMNCPASVRLESHFPSQSYSPFAAEGTAAHELGEICLTTGVDDVSTKIGQIINVNQDGVKVKYVVNQDMADAVQVYVDYVNSVAQDCDLFLIEEQVSLVPIRDDMFGTADCIIVKDGVCHVIDYKHGAGIKVDAFENTQGLYYAAGVHFSYGKTFGIKEYVITIVQPRMDNISEYRVTTGQLNQWIENELKPAVTATEQEDAPFGPSSKACQWCKAKGDCRALADHAMSVALEGFDFDSYAKAGKKPVFKNPDLLDEKQLSYLYGELKLVKQWCGFVEKKALEVLESGSELPGYKLVTGRSSRQWRDEKLAVKALKNKGLKVGEIFTRKLISPTQVEKLLGKDSPILNKHVVKPTGKPTVVRENDSRTSVNSMSDALEGFDFNEIKRGLKHV